MSNLFKRFVRNDSGQDLVEYAFLIVFIALVAAIGLNALGIGVRDFYNDIAGVLTGVGPITPPTPGT
ncbi:MAG TPA: Flp family type IVb pilin [Vicinamibacterales bacterium]|jgi:Flp pilus assembly pilin Flp|nr:Flp family type IVb pilin [Vicinamibacterales bacterium]